MMACSSLERILSSSGDSSSEEESSYLRTDSENEQMKKTGRVEANGSSVLKSRDRRLSRENTKEERKAMKKARKKRKRKRVKELKQEIESERKEKEKAESLCTKYRCMSRTYWERWRWELHQRREAMVRERMATKRCSVKLVLPSIDPSMLEDPAIDGKIQECYVGRGSFGIVRLQVYRTIPVAVKEFLPRSLADDVTNEANLLASLCHPYLPCLFGVCLKEKPFRLVMQYHAIKGMKASTFSQEVYRNPQVFEEKAWILFCAQLVEAVHYLHNDACVLHNDITTSNILITNNDGYHIVLIDFGKATTISQAKFYRLSMHEKHEYTIKYRHLAPEVIDGQQKQSIYSDMYSVGLVFYRVTDHCHLSQNKRKDLAEFAQKCRSIKFYTRPKSSEALKFFETLKDLY